MAFIAGGTARILRQVAGLAGAALLQLRGFRLQRALMRFLRDRAHPRTPPSTVLIWDMGNFPEIIARNGIFATALKLRGEQIHTVLCDGTPVACIRRGVEQPEALDEWSRRCGECSRNARRAAEKYCLEYSMAGDHVDSSKRIEFQQLAASLPLHEIYGNAYLGSDVGRMAWSSLNRYMKGILVEIGGLDPEQERIYRKYFYAALVNVHAASEALKKISPSSVFTSHGVYVDYAPAMSIAYRRGLPAVSWSSAYADCHHYFTLPKGPNQLLIQGVSRNDLWDERAATPLTPAEEGRLDEFLHHRYFRAGARDIDVISPPEDRESLRRKIGLRPGKPVFCVFAHVNWDACFDMSSMIYPNANVWIVETMKRMLQNTAVDWLVRVHPGELTDGSVLSTGDIIKSEFRGLPDHVRILGADSEINSWGLYQLVDGGITIFGTAGVELAALGKPVILAGEAHYGRKGFTIDSDSEAAYRDALDRVASITPLSAWQAVLARRYAYWYFVQRQIPVRAVDPGQGHWGDLDLNRMDSLLPGRDAIMDSVCSNIVQGKDFILPTGVVP